MKNIDQGLSIQTEFSLNPGTQDYFGIIIPQNTSYDIGASEYKP